MVVGETNHFRKHPDQMLADDCSFFFFLKMSNLKNTPISKLFETNKSFKFVGPMQILHFLGVDCIRHVLSKIFPGLIFHDSCQLHQSRNLHQLFSHRFRPKFLPWGRLMALRLAHLGDLGTSWRIETGDLDVKISSSRWCTYQMVEPNNGSIHVVPRLLWN